MPGFSVEFGPSLKNTKINGSIVFEEYDNPNLSNFPYSSFIFDDNNPSNHIAIFKFLFFLTVFIQSTNSSSVLFSSFLKYLTNSIIGNISSSL